MKGDGETHPKISPADAFADFEIWDRSNLADTKAKEDWMLPFEYARSGLRDGLVYEKNMGTNPFKMGLVGGTDIHTGLSTVEENNFYGKFVGSEPSASRMFGKVGGQFDDNVELGVQGLTAVWAEGNTREAIFDAIARREVYASTGPRIKVRLFAGGDLSKETPSMPVDALLKMTVPMGHDIPSQRDGLPSFVIQAHKDVNSVNLERVKVVKGWLSEDGQTHEKVIDVETNLKGQADFNVFWQDESFDPNQATFYYVRVLELPTKRWTTFDAEKYSLDLPKGVPSYIQERVYSSPVWYRAER